MKTLLHSFLLVILIASMSAAGQSNELDEAYNQYRASYKQEDYASAVIWAEKSVVLAEKEFGKEHETHTLFLNDLVLLYASTGSNGELELTEQIKKVPALKQVLILDTCHSGRFSEDMTKDRAISSSQIRAYERMKDRTGLHILAGAAADAVAYESSSYGQGILTYSLLLGMRGAALRDDEYIDISRLFQYSADQVPVLAKNIGGIQRPIVAVPYGGTSFDIGRLSSEDKPRIPLAQVRPLVLRALFQNDAPPFKDNLDLGKLLNITFREISTRGREASLIFIDADEFPLANQLSGRYNVTGNSVTVTIYITQGDETKANFQVQGNKENLEQLVADILKETEQRISNKKEEN